MNKTMEKSYTISRVILAIMVFIILNITLVIEVAYLRIVPLILALITFAFSFPSSAISRKLISIGTKLESKLLKILYYIIVLPIIIFLFFCGIYIISIIPRENAFSAAFTQEIMVLLLNAVGLFGIVLPYVQTLIVLILNRFIKN